MTFGDAIILGALQGVTEFLPVSSSGHLVLGESILGLEVEILKSFDVMVHLGSLLAILIYFWGDIWKLTKSFVFLIVGKREIGDPWVKLGLLIIIGTIPAVIVGFGLGDLIDGYFRDVEAVAMAMLGVGVLFLLGEYFYRRRDHADLKSLGFGKVFWIGLAQACALIPGVSRSGSTIITGMIQGIKREEAARFSFLLGVPAIAGAGILTALKAVDGGVSIDLSVMGVGFISSFVMGILSIHFLMQFLKKWGLNVFGIYLILVGLVFLF